MNASNPLNLKREFQFIYRLHLDNMDKLTLCHLKQGLKYEAAVIETGKIDMVLARILIVKNSADRLKHNCMKLPLYKIAAGTPHSSDVKMLITAIDRSKN